MEKYLLKTRWLSHLKSPVSTSDCMVNLRNYQKSLPTIETSACFLLQLFSSLTDNQELTNTSDSIVHLTQQPVCHDSCHVVKCFILQGSVQLSLFSAVASSTLNIEGMRLLNTSKFMAVHTFGVQGTVSLQITMFSFIIVSKNGNCSWAAIEKNKPFLYLIIGLN